MPRGLYLTILVIIVVCAYADRYLIGVVVEQLRMEFALSDLQIGLINGPAFALLFTIAGLPLARWSDVGDRRTIIAVSLAVWSVFTALCGTAQGFVTFLLARAGVGLGEAGSGPPVHALAAGYYPLEKRGGVASALTAATFIGALVGAGVGGLSATAYGWRTTFLAFGAAGLALVLLAFFLKEPRTERPAIRLGELFGARARTDMVRLLSRRSYFYLVVGLCFYTAFSQSLSTFGIPFLMRNFGFTEAQVGPAWGLTLAVSSLLGASAAAPLINRASTRSPAWLGIAPGILVAIAGPAFAAAFFSAAPTLFYVLAGVALALIAFSGPFVFAALYAVSADRERSLAIALMLFISNLAGLSLGPLAGGALSDALANAGYGADSLRHTLIAATIALVAAGACFARAGAFLAADRSNLEGAESGASKPLPA